MKKLPVGIQDFAKIIEGGYLYVDKTKHLFELAQEGTYYFLSRPRRFGKSLLISTLKYLFEGRKDLFAGMWIEDKIEWPKHPVIHIDFTLATHQADGLKNALLSEVARNAAAHSVVLEAESAAARFGELIRKLSVKGKVVLLIDEYDKPIIDNLEPSKRRTAAENRDLLKPFYGVIKGSDQYIRFCMLTGVSKFSHVSVFSDLNNLEDISMSRHYSDMLGYTQAELELFFADRLDFLAPDHGGRENLLAQIKEWYNGYSWDGEKKVYNPFSVLRFMKEGAFKNHWFETATPTFLIDLLKGGNYDLVGLDGQETTESAFSGFDPETLHILPLLFQTGYLTVKKLEGRIYTLGYPNREVAEAFSEHLLDGFAARPGLAGTIYSMREALKKGDAQKFCYLVSGVFEAVKYPHIEKKEAYFHSIFYLIIKLLGFEVESEVLNARGRMDAVVKTENHIYILEFKLGKSARAAIDQIVKKGYAGAYALDARPVTLIGLAYDPEKMKLMPAMVRKAG